jgi:hypothetical protein
VHFKHLFIQDYKILPSVSLLAIKAQLHIGFFRAAAEAPTPLKVSGGLLHIGLCDEISILT